MRSWFRRVEELRLTEKVQQEVAMGTLHLPFNEVAMKMSGFVDRRCRRITELELAREDSAGQAEVRHVRIATSESANSDTIPSTRPSVISPVGALQMRRLLCCRRRMR